MSEVPYDPSGRVQNTGRPGYAQYSTGKGGSGGGGSEGSGAIIGVGITAILYALLHIGCCSLFAFAGSMVVGLAEETFADAQFQDPQLPDQGGDPQMAMNVINAVAGVLMFIGIIGIVYGVGCLVGAIGLFVRKRWGRIIVLIYAVCSAIEGMLLLLLIGLGVFGAVVDGAAIDFLGLLVNAAIMVFFLAFGMASFSTLRRYGEQFS